MSPWGQAIYDTEPVVHTGIDKHLRISSFLKKAIRTLGLQNLRFRKRQPLSAMIDWYILGECDVLISTMTSYAIMAGQDWEIRKQITKLPAIANIAAC
ncbi:MAG: hypothetical protein HC849_17715 [Oscillatoriales cyanobacterium RU_3_3]|nr:hypothetical protein [Oscillatoriales cyanobacterium RU_3_3]